MRVMFDIDGCLRNIIPKWQELWRTQFGYTPGVPFHWDYFVDVGERHGMAREETYHLMFNTWGWELMATAPAYFNARYAVDAVRELGHRVILATHQMNITCQKATLHWLSRNSVVPDELIFTEDKLEARADFYLEDRQKTLVALAEQAEGQVVGMVRPWNRPDELNIAWVRDPLAYAHLISEVPRGK